MVELPLRRWQNVQFLGKRGYTPNRWSLDAVHSRPERFIAIVTTRQTGKTVTAGMEIDEGMCKPSDDFGPPWVGVMAPAYDKAELSINMYITMLTETFGKDSYRMNQNKHELTILDPAAGTIGARLKWLSSDDPYSLVGYTFSKLIVDESQSVPDEGFQKIRPTLDVRNAKMVCFGTADDEVDQTWFAAMQDRGTDPLDKDYHSYRVTAYENPWMALDTIEDAKRNLPDAEFRRLYMAERVERDGRVFTNYEGSLLDRVPAFNPNTRHVMSADFAATEDFNVVMVGESATRTAIFKDRWNNIPQTETLDRIAEINVRFGRPRIFVDETGFGNKAYANGLRERGLTVSGVNFQNKNKMEMITALAADLQHRKIMFPVDWVDVKKELDGFVYKRTASGLLTANAATGFHDDCVISLALLNHAMRSRSSTRKQFNYLENGQTGLVYAR